jgi:hypothetical protein
MPTHTIERVIFMPQSNFSHAYFVFLTYDITYVFS